MTLEDTLIQDETLVHSPEWPENAECELKAEEMLTATVLRVHGKPPLMGNVQLRLASHVGTFWPLRSLGDDCDLDEVKAINIGQAVILRIYQFTRCPSGMEHYHFHSD